MKATKVENQLRSLVVRAILDKRNNSTCEKEKANIDAALDLYLEDTELAIASRKLKNQ